MEFIKIKFHENDDDFRRMKKQIEEMRGYEITVFLDYSKKDKPENGKWEYCNNDMLFDIVSQ